MEIIVEEFARNIEQPLAIDSLLNGYIFTWFNFYYLLSSDLIEYTARIMPLVALFLLLEGVSVSINLNISRRALLRFKT
jgi:hypothetical protein